MPKRHHSTSIVTMTVASTEYCAQPKNQQGGVLPSNIDQIAVQQINITDNFRIENPGMQWTIDITQLVLLGLDINESS
jgi:hypothetical protein